MRRRYLLAVIVTLMIAGIIMSQRNKSSNSIGIARLKYNGGGDWYSSRTALHNLALFCNKNIGTTIKSEEAIVEASSEDIFLYPYVFMTGHGNVIFNPRDIQNIRTYLSAGGFLHICDNYGMDKNIRREIKRLFPDKKLREVPFSHAIYHGNFNFDQGLPKIHKHEGYPPQGLGIFDEERLILFYDYESDLGNGWEDAETYNDPENIRMEALKMGANIIQYAFNKD